MENTNAQTKGIVTVIVIGVIVMFLVLLGLGSGGGSSSSGTKSSSKYTCYECGDHYDSGNTRYKGHNFCSESCKARWALRQAWPED